MIPNSATRREKPARSVNITAQFSPNRSQMRASMRFLSAPGFRRSSIRLSRRSCEALVAMRPMNDMGPVYPRRRLRTRAPAGPAEMLDDLYRLG